MIEPVACGPGPALRIPGNSPVAERVSSMSLERETLGFAACGNTRKAMEARAGHDIAPMTEAQVVPSGVVRLIELQEQGRADLRPRAPLPSAPVPLGSGP